MHTGRGVVFEDKIRTIRPGKEMAMKALGGAVVVLGGAVLAGSGIIAVTLAHSMRGPDPAEGYIGELAGAVLVVIGLAAFLLSSLPDREERPRQGRQQP
jgi:hypothetical protein